MTPIPHRAPGGPRPALTAAVLVALVAVTGPRHALAQAPDVPEVEREELVRYAQAHLAINAARDELHADMGRTHDAPGRERVRADFEAKVDAALEARELTRERYALITWAISVDEALRVRFEAVLEELGGSG